LLAAVVAFFAVPTPAGACAFVTLTVYRAAVTNAVNNIAAVIMNDICTCIGLQIIERYIRFLYELRNLLASRAMGGGGTPTDSPTLKISMREYEVMAIKVGDKITVEIKKSDSSSGR
jgi:hypothetical protein